MTRPEITGRKKERGKRKKEWDLTCYPIGVTGIATVVHTNKRMHSSTQSLTSSVRVGGWHEKFASVVSRFRARASDEREMQERGGGGEGGDGEMKEEMTAERQRDHLAGLIRPMNKQTE